MNLVVDPGGGALTSEIGRYAAWRVKNLGSICAEYGQNHSLMCAGICTIKWLKSIKTYTTYTITNIHKLNSMKSLPDCTGVKLTKVIFSLDFWCPSVSWSKCAVCCFLSVNLCCLLRFLGAICAACRWKRGAKPRSIPTYWKYRSNTPPRLKLHREKNKWKLNAPETTK